MYPEPLRDDIDAVNEVIYADINNGVYKAGFATSQQAYEDAVDRLFERLDWVEARLAQQRYLVGTQLTEADIRLFTTLVRFDSVYFGHFKCNLRRLVDYPHLWGYARDLFQRPGFGETVNFDHIKRHYYMTHDHINPTRIVPKGPIIDWAAPHDRARLDPEPDAVRVLSTAAKPLTSVRDLESCARRCRVSAHACPAERPRRARLAVSCRMRIPVTLALSLTLMATVAAQQPAQAPPPLVKENATVKLSEHVYAIPDDSVPLVPNVGIIVGGNGHARRRHRPRPAQR